MKAKLNKEQVSGIINLELKYISCKIEYKWFQPNNQLNLKEISVSYKIKNTMERRKHAYDYLKKEVKDFIIRKIKESNLCKNFQVKPEIIWWSTK